MLVDTNVLLLAAQAGRPGSDACAGFLDELRHGARAWHLTWPIAYEFLRVSTHPRVFERPLTLQQAGAFLDCLHEGGSLRMLVNGDDHRRVLQDIVDELPHVAGSTLHDLHSAALMREHGLRDIASLDADFRQFPFLTVVDPRAPR